MCPHDLVYCLPIVTHYSYWTYISNHQSLICVCLFQKLGQKIHLALAPPLNHFHQSTMAFMFAWLSLIELSITINSDGIRIAYSCDFNASMVEAPCCLKLSSSENETPEIHWHHILLHQLVSCHVCWWCIYCYPNFV